VRHQAVARPSSRVERPSNSRNRPGSTTLEHMQRFFFLACAANGFLAVALGAFGAHGLKTSLADLPDVAQRLAWWQTAANYHLFHALALGFLALAAERLPRLWVRLAGGSLLAGMLLFSGSLYAMTLSGLKELGAITPFGGLGLLIGWAALGLGAWRMGSARGTDGGRAIISRSDEPHP
jgi:uncharacterized membrane protein YgdD (TMEM256/DUF423 family)